MARRLHERNLDVTTSLAGRTREPSPIKGKVRVGSFGGADGLATFIRENSITLLIDMTHPFATRMSENALHASRIANVPILAWHRPGWELMDGDQWTKVPDVAAAVAAIPHGARVLLALGSQHIAPFAERTGVHFLVRMVDQPKALLPLPDHELLLAKPGTVEQELALLRGRNITHIICRNSGGKASYTKIAAARLLGIPVILIGRNQPGAASISLDDFERRILASLS